MNDETTQPREPGPFERECRRELRAKVTPVEALTEDEIAESDADALKAKLEQYESQANALLTAFTNTFDRFSTTKSAYELIFAKIEAIDVSLETVIGAQPDDSTTAFEDAFTVVELAEYSAYASSSVSFLKFCADVRKYRKAAQAAQAARAQAVATGAPIAGGAGPMTVAQAQLSQVANLSDDIVKIRKMAMASGLFALVTAGAGIGLRFHEENLRKDHYSRNLPAYEEWFKDTVSKVIQLCAAQKYMRKEIEDLKVTVGVTPPGAETDHELVNVLNNQVRRAGEVEAAMTAAARSMCMDVSAADALLYSGLPNTPYMLNLFNNLRNQLLADNKELCKTDYPDLPIT